MPCCYCGASIYSPHPRVSFLFTPDSSKVTLPSLQLVQYGVRFQHFGAPESPSFPPIKLPKLSQEFTSPGGRQNVGLPSIAKNRRNGPSAVSFLSTQHDPTIHWNCTWGHSDRTRERRHRRRYSRRCRALDSTTYYPRPAYVGTGSGVPRYILGNK